MKPTAHILFFALLLNASCAPTPPTPTTYSTPGGGLLGLGISEGPVPDDWQRRHPASPSLDGPDPPLLFDAWQIEDLHFRETLFTALFPLIQSLQALPEDADHRGLELLLILLSAELPHAEMELLFFSQTDAAREGLLLRIVEAEGTGIWLEGSRSLQGASEPDRWILRAEPAFDQAPGLTLWWHRSDSSWEASWAPGADALPSAGRPAPLTSDPFLILWEETLWNTVTGERSLRPPFPVVAQTPDRKLAPGWPSTLGQPLQDRGLDHLETESVFWPRTIQDPLEAF